MVHTKLDCAAYRPGPKSPWPPRCRFMAIINLVLLLLGLLVFGTEVSRDGYASIFGLVLGVPLLVVQALAGLLGIIFAVEDRGAITKNQQLIFLTLSTLPTVIGVTGLILAMTLTPTHGTC